MNDKKAAFWYKKAAKQGYVIAQNNLGYMYKEGKGVRVNTKKAYNWYHKAAQVGYASAQTNLAYLYRMGIGIERDINAAFEWFVLISPSFITHSLLHGNPLFRNYPRIKNPKPFFFYVF